MTFSSKRSRATDIPKSVKDAVWRRDRYSCIICGSFRALPNAHVISRAEGGLGVERNIVTLCPSCHQKMDNSPERKRYLAWAIGYLKTKYPNWKEEDLIYKKGGNNETKEESNGTGEIYPSVGSSNRPSGDTNSAS